MVKPLRQRAWRGSRVQLTCAVLMIRASNLPVLLGIALHERQQYRETTVMEQIGDFVERYTGTLPRRLKAAGKSYDIPEPGWD
jgi:hypothetical protein